MHFFNKNLVNLVKTKKFFISFFNILNLNKFSSKDFLIIFTTILDSVYRARYRTYGVLEKNITILYRLSDTQYSERNKTPREAAENLQRFGHGEFESKFRGSRHVAQRLVDCRSLETFYAHASNGENRWSRSVENHQDARAGPSDESKKSIIVRRVREIFVG